MISPLRWPAEALWEALEPRLPGFTVEVLPSIDSTNTELMRRARASRNEPTLLVAEQQTAGRGRLGRTWHSDAGASLMFSLALPMAPVDWSGLSLAVGLSVAESLQPELPTSAGHARLGLKWPNDLWLSDADGDRKLGGILVETASLVAPGVTSAAASTSAPGRFVVIGMGLNVLPRSAEGLSLPPASLHDLNPTLDGPGTLLRVLPPLVDMLQSFERAGFAPLRSRFAARDVLLGRTVALSDGLEGVAEGVAADGALLVRNATGLHTVTSSDLSVRPRAR